MFVSLLAALFAGVLGKFSPAGIDSIVQEHNALRSSIALGKFVAGKDHKPPAANMRLINWDDELAEQAQKYADSCPEGHSGSPGVGENLYFAWGSRQFPDADQLGVTASQAWKSEFDGGWPTNQLTVDLFASGVGHATQMAWASTSLIGCGVRMCSPRTAVVVCQYKDQGNMFGQMIYEEGATCSDCPLGHTCNLMTGLCQ